MAFAKTQGKRSTIVKKKKKIALFVNEKIIFLKVGLNFDKQRRKGKNFHMFTQKENLKQTQNDLTLNFWFTHHLDYIWITFSLKTVTFS